jgi:hypothetical protein
MLNGESSLNITERGTVEVTLTELYSRGARFESRSGHRLRIFLVFLSLSMQTVMPRCYFPNFSRLINHRAIYIL